MDKIYQSVVVMGLVAMAGCATIPVRPNGCNLGETCGGNARLTTQVVAISDSPSNAIELNQTVTLSDLGLTEAQFSTNMAQFIATAISVDLSQSNVVYTGSGISVAVTLLNGASPVASVTIQANRAGNTLAIVDPGSFTNWIQSHSSGVNAFHVHTAPLAFTPIVGTNTNTVIGNYKGSAIVAGSVSDYGTQCQINKMNHVNICSQQIVP
jgi:hypothetical protein